MDYIIWVIMAYLLGSIPTGLLVGKIGYKMDIREHGSGNLGATNAFRVMGMKPGIIVIVVDILKGTIATVLPLLFGVDIIRLIVGLFAVLGHTYPVFARFKGGKAVATSGGIILGVNPILFGIMVVTFIMTLYLSKYVSLSSIVTGVVSFIAAIVLGDIGLMIVIGVLTIFVAYRHRANIKRIKNKTEPKITWL